MGVEWQPQGASPQTCPFCGAGVLEGATLRSETAMALRDAFPASEGHMLVLPKRHVADYFDLTAAERRDIDDLLGQARGLILESDPTVAGFNVGINCGIVAGQTVLHAHVHLIPRRAGDVPDPRGGVRAVMPGKVRYW